MRQTRSFAFIHIPKETKINPGIPRIGRVIRFQVLRDGNLVFKELAGFPLERQCTMHQVGVSVPTIRTLSRNTQGSLFEPDCKQT